MSAMSFMSSFYAHSLSSSSDPPDESDEPSSFSRSGFRMKDVRSASVGAQSGDVGSYSDMSSIDAVAKGVVGE